MLEVDFLQLRVASTEALIQEEIIRLRTSLFLLEMQGCRIQDACAPLDLASEKAP